MKRFLVQLDTHVCLYFFPQHIPRGLLMQCKMSQLFDKPSIFNLDFDLELPILPSTSFDTRSLGLLRPLSPRGRRAYAWKAAKLIYGNSPIEIQDPVATIEMLIDELSFIKGAVSLDCVNRYRLSLGVAKLFNPPKVGNKVANLFHKNFYPERKFIFHAAEFDVLSANLTPGQTGGS